MSSKERQRRVFTEAFRQQQVRLIEQKQSTVSEVSRRYQVSRSAVYKWLSKYGKSSDSRHFTVVGSGQDVDRLLTVEKKHKELQALFGEQQVKLIRLEHLLDLAKEQLGADFEKKCDSRY